MTSVAINDSHAVRGIWTDTGEVARAHPMLSPKSAFAGFRFPPEVIMVAVRRHLRFNLSYRDVEELLVERAVEVDHVTCTLITRQPLVCDLLP